MTAVVARWFSTFRALGGIDLTNVRRDPMLAWLAVVPLGLALGFFWGIAPLTAILNERFEFDLVPYYPLILGFLVLAMPGFVGVILGFLLLDQRDDGTLTALQVTPLRIQSYLFYRAVAPMLVSLVMTVVTLPFTGLMTAGLWSLVLSAAVAAPLGPIFALFLASYAANKVQGFALMKGSGVVSWPAILAWFLPMPWQLWCGAVPHYWIVKVVWVIEDGGQPWTYAVIALLFQLGLLLFLLRRFDRVTTR